LAAGLARAKIDGILGGSTVSPHIMLATVFAEHFGIGPSYAHAVQVGGATGLARTMLAHHLIDAGVARHVLVVGGENRLTGQSRDASIAALAQVGHPDYEVPLGPTIPAYYDPRRLALHARIRLGRARSRRVRGADARACGNPSRDAVPRPDHGSPM
jgi:acetyl-CoA acetyltransferase